MDPNNQKPFNIDNIRGLLFMIKFWSFKIKIFTYYLEMSNWGLKNQNFWSIDIPI